MTPGTMNHTRPYHTSAPPYHHLVWSNARMAKQLSTAAHCICFGASPPAAAVRLPLSTHPPTHGMRRGTLLHPRPWRTGMVRVRRTTDCTVCAMCADAPPRRSGTPSLRATTRCGGASASPTSTPSGPSWCRSASATAGGVACSRTHSCRTPGREGGGVYGLGSRPAAQGAGCAGNGHWEMQHCKAADLPHEL